GTIAIDDLGTVNGVYAKDVRVEGRAPVHAGVEMRIGHTVLRFRDVNEVVAPALVDDRAARAAVSNGAAAGNGALAAPASVTANTLHATTRRSLGAWIIGSAPGRVLAVAA